LSNALDLVAEVIQFRSGIDGSEQKVGLCGPALPPAGELLPLLVELEPASIQDLDATLADGRRHLELLGQPAVWLRPGGRGPGTVFQGYGAVDVFEAIATAAARYPIDPDRVSLYGFSMGGAGVWYMASHYPDRFSAIAPMGAYNDFRLWRRPGGMTFPLMPWEVASWRARSAIFLMENLRHVGVWMVHGGWDRAVGGGVDVEQARRSAARLDTLGIPYRYTELQEIGHNRAFMKESFFGEVLRWLAEQRRITKPTQVTVRTQDLHHGSAYWVDIKQLGRYAEFGQVDARIDDARLKVETENVRHLALRPQSSALTSASITIDDTHLQGVDLRQPVGLRRDAAEWRIAEIEPPAGEKRPGLGGPFGGLFERGTVLVRGTTGSKEETFFQEWCSRDAAQFFKDWNGGIHRGGIAGTSWVALPISTDVEWLATNSADETGDSRNAVAYGTPLSNAVLNRVAESLGVYAEHGAVHVGDRELRGDGLGLIAVTPFPDGSRRYLAMHGGTTPDATTAGAHLNWQLLPDYLVYDAHRAIEWGFFDNEWRPVPAGDGGEYVDMDLLDEEERSTKLHRGVEA
jgi:pimeloyl-ACP methyl ester carboxylesterase